jgi:PTS system fructose-specific IIC component
MTSTASRPIIAVDLVLLDVDAGADKQAVIGRLVGRLADAGRTTDPDGLIAAAMAREEQSATGLPGGIAIPHCRSPHVDTASVGIRPSTSAHPTARRIWRSSSPHPRPAAPST